MTVELLERLYLEIRNKDTNSATHMKSAIVLSTLGKLVFLCIIYFFYVKS